MNGLDTVEWDPAADEWLPVAARLQGPSDAARGKAEAKLQLQQLLGLATDPQVVLSPFWFETLSLVHTVHNS